MEPISGCAGTTSSLFRIELPTLRYVALTWRNAAACSRSTEKTRRSGRALSSEPRLQLLRHLLLLVRDTCETAAGKVFPTIGVAPSLLATASDDGIQSDKGGSRALCSFITGTFITGSRSSPRSSAMIHVSFLACRGSSKSYGRAFDTLLLLSYHGHSLDHEASCNGLLLTLYSLQVQKCRNLRGCTSV